MNVFKFFESNQLCIKQNAAFHRTLDKLTEGKYLLFEGTVKNNCLRFSLDLVSANPNNPSLPNIALHVNPRLEQRYTVRNCRINGAWGDEETTSLMPFDFLTNNDFSIGVLVCANEFMVTVNEKHYCAFAFRIPVEQIQAVEVLGAVNITKFTTSDIKFYPIQTSPYFEIPFDADFDEDADNNLVLPFTGILPKGFKPGWQLEVYGKIKLLPHSFYVNLQDGAQHWPHPIIPLHLNPRFSTSVGANTFVRNSWSRQNSWSNEERAPVFPFVPGYSFCMVIRMESEGYSVWVDGKLTAEFPYTHETNVPVSTVYIQGDVRIKHVTMRRKIVDTYFQNKKEIVKKL